MDYDIIIEGLKDRGFVNTEGIDSMGECHKDEKHYILLTDGLVIYSNIPYHSDEEHYRDSLVESWCIEKSEYDTTTREFSFLELDEIMKL